MDTTSDISVDVEEAREFNWPTAIEPSDALGVCAGEPEPPALAVSLYFRYRNMYCAPKSALTTIMTLVKNMATTWIVLKRDVCVGSFVDWTALLICGNITSDGAVISVNENMNTAWFW